MYQTLNYFISFPDSPTYYPKGRGRPSTLDLVLSHNLVDMSKPVVLNDLSSDHLPVIFDIRCSIVPSLVSNTTFCYTRANWPAFQSALNRCIDLTNPIITTLNDGPAIERAISFFSESIIAAKNAAVPKVEIHPYQVPNLPAHTKTLVCLRNRRRRHWMRTRDPLYNDIVESLN